MKHKPLISILLPIFNVEKYLVECLNSIVNQTLKTIEIICINDGSTDSSLEIIKSYMKNDSRIKLIDKLNSGYGDSMNQGLKLATGEYIGIVESDDITDKKMFKELYLLANTNNFPDIIKSNYYDFWTNTTNKKLNDNLPKETHNELFNPKENKNIFFSLPSIWSAIYKRTFLVDNEIIFNPTPGASYQDTGFYFKTLSCAKKMFCTPKAYLYYRRDNENSSVNNKEKVYCIYDEFESIDKFINKNKLLELTPLFYGFQFDHCLKNYNRIHNKFKPDFINYVKKIYTEMKNQNIIKKEFFDDTSWILLTSLLEGEENFLNEHNKINLSYVEPLCSKLEQSLKKSAFTSIILYGFNDIAKKLLEKNQWKDIEIIDKNQSGTIYKNITISNIDQVEFTNNKVVVITAVNPIFIEEIKSLILNKNLYIQLITL